jgi:hypothetical protein
LAFRVIMSNRALRVVWRSIRPYRPRHFLELNLVISASSAFGALVTPFTTADA